jgi:hypothetical protein
MSDEYHAFIHASRLSLAQPRAILTLNCFMHTCSLDNFDSIDFTLQFWTYAHPFDREWPRNIGDIKVCTDFKMLKVKVPNIFSGT